MSEFTMATDHPRTEDKIRQFHGRRVDQAKE